MKKLNLGSLREFNEVISREQMKSIIGGLGSGGEDDSDCNNKPQCKKGEECRNYSNI